MKQEFETHAPLTSAAPGSPGSPGSIDIGSNQEPGAPASPAPRSLSNSISKHWVMVAKVAFSSGLLWLLFSRIDIGQFWSVARRSSVPWLTAALAAYLVAVFASSWRWHRLLLIQNVRMSFRTVTESFVVALFFNNFLPTNIGGDVMRVRDTAGPAGSSTRATTVVVADRIIGLMGLVFFAALGGIVSTQDRLPFSVAWIWVIFLAGAAASFAVLLVPATIDRLLQPFAFLRRGWIGAQIEGLTHSLINFRAAPVGLAASFAAAIFVQGANIAFYSAVARALGVHVGIWDMAVIVPLSALIQVVPVSVNGLGLREAAFTFFFTRLGLPAEAALLVSLEATAMILAFSLLGALLYIGRQFPARELGSAVQPATVSPRL